MSRKLLFIFLLFQFCALGIQAQTSEKQSYWGLGLGLQTTAWKDQMVTQSTYHGTNLFFSINHRKEKNKTIRLLDIDNSLGRLKTNLFNLEDQ